MGPSGLGAYLADQVCQPAVDILSGDLFIWSSIQAFLAIGELGLGRSILPR